MAKDFMKAFSKAYDTVEQLAKTKQLTAKFENLNKALDICKELAAENEDITVGIEYEFTDAELSLQCYTFDIMMPEMPKLRELLELVDTFVVTPLVDDTVKITMDIKDVFKI